MSNAICIQSIYQMLKVRHPYCKKVLWNNSIEPTVTLLFFLFFLFIDLVLITRQIGFICFHKLQ